jgi:hypothetical protein
VRLARRLGWSRAAVCHMNHVSLESKKALVREGYAVVDVGQLAGLEKALRAVVALRSHKV